MTNIERLNGYGVEIVDYVELSTKQPNRIEKIERSAMHNDHELDGVNILLNIKCPICGRHTVLSRSYAIVNPVFETPRPLCTAVVGCAHCAAVQTCRIPSSMSLDEYKFYLNEALVPNWIDAVSKDDRVHAWRRDNLFNVVNNKLTQEFWEYQANPMLASIIERHKSTLEALSR